MAAGECAEKLVVEIVAVGEHDDRRILHLRMRHQPPGVKRHRQRFARPCVCQTTPTRLSPVASRLLADLFLPTARCSQRA